MGRIGKFANRRTLAVAAVTMSAVTLGFFPVTSARAADEAMSSDGNVSEVESAAQNSHDAPGESSGTHQQLFGWWEGWDENSGPMISGLDTVAAIWNFNLNDEGAAPGNQSVDNNVLTVELENGRFLELPDACLTGVDEGAGYELDPVSEISADQTKLLCNIGRRDQGTAQVAVAGVMAWGVSGSQLTAEATVNGLNAQMSEKLDPIEIAAPFKMDAKFDAGQPLSATGDDDWQLLAFPFLVNHSRGSVAGPDQVVYDLTIKPTKSDRRVVLRNVDGENCVPQERAQAQYPFSEPKGADGARTTNFPTCHLEQLDDNGNFRLTLSDLDYSADFPLEDSVGVPWLSEFEPIAAGELLLQANYSHEYDQNGYSVKLQASAPEYCPAGSEPEAQCVQDDVSNNSNSVAVVRGSWSGGWIPSRTQPQGYGGSTWQANAQVPAGAPVLSMVTNAVGYDHQHRGDQWMCTVYDTEFVDLEDAWVSVRNETPYLDRTDAELWYYTGDWVNPDGSPTDPNFFECGGDLKYGDDAFGNPDGWSTTRPADMASVKAVKVRNSPELGNQSNMPGGGMSLVSQVRIHNDAPIGQDIWMWNTILRNDWADSWKWEKAGLEFNDRTETKGSVFGVNTPGKRYAYTGPMRDMITVASSIPTVQTTVAQKQYGSGNIAEYETKASLESVHANPNRDTLIVTETLPSGLSYVENSASFEPTIQSDGKVEKLTWEFADVLPNEDPIVINWKAQIPDDMNKGIVNNNVATAFSQGNTRTDRDSFVIPDHGYTSLVLTPEEERVLDEDGVAHNAWHVNLTSYSPNVQDATDVVVLLPFNGDERGSDFQGQIQLSGPVEAAAGGAVYYTRADALDLEEDPEHGLNGGFGEPSDIWSTDFMADATAVRVVGGPLKFGEVQETVIPTVTEGAGPGDRYVARSAGRSSETALKMRSSAEWSLAEDGSPTVPPIDPPEPPTEPTEPPIEPPIDPTEPPTGPTGPGGETAPGVLPGATVPEGHLASTGAFTVPTGVLILLAVGGFALLVLGRPRSKR